MISLVFIFQPLLCFFFFILQVVFFFFLPQVFFFLLLFFFFHLHISFFLPLSNLLFSTKVSAPTILLSNLASFFQFLPAAIIFIFQFQLTLIYLLGLAKMLYIWLMHIKHFEDLDYFHYEPKQVISQFLLFVANF